MGEPAFRLHEWRCKRQLHRVHQLRRPYLKLASACCDAHNAHPTAISRSLGVPFSVLCPVLSPKIAAGRAIRTTPIRLTTATSLVEDSPEKESTHSLRVSLGARTSLQEILNQLPWCIMAPGKLIQLHQTETGTGVNNRRQKGQRS